MGPAGGAPAEVIDEEDDSQVGYYHHCHGECQMKPLIIDMFHLNRTSLMWRRKIWLRPYGHLWKNLMRALLDERVW